MLNGPVRSVQQRLGRDTLEIGLWLNEAVVGDPSVESLRDDLDRLGVIVRGCNGFPQTSFHNQVVKRSVYRPHWGEVERLRYTKRLAEVLVKIGHGPVREISTVPIGHQELGPEMLPTAVSHLLLLVDFLSALEERSGIRVVVDLEPEPDCLLECSSDVIGLFDRLGDAPSIRRYLGVCHDTCHAAVVREPQKQAIAAYQKAEIRIGKVQCSSVPVVDLSVPEQREFLKQLDEPRWLHQTSVELGSGLARYEDLAGVFKESEGIARVHFHVPVHLDHLGPLRTTRDEIFSALTALPDDPDRIVEVETYAWSALPDSVRPDLLEGITLELESLA
ncbi:MAG: xylose isomerase [Phycisphaerae bacterium]|nr:xylose isomerase [Phycisphaerae bacterium]